MFRFAHRRTLIPCSFAAAFVCAAMALPAQSPNPKPPSADNDALLAKIGQRYYSATRATQAHGTLDGFECTVHPDWQTLLDALDKAAGRAAAGQNAASPDPRLALLNAVSISTRVEISGRSFLNWSQAADEAHPLDAESTETLDRAHQTVEHGLEGFFQFWTPFINGTIIPATSEGIHVDHSAAGTTIHAEMGEQKLNEIFAPDQTLKEFNVSMSGVEIRMTPAFDSTSEGLLIKSFDAKIQLPGTPPPPERAMKVALDYQSVQGYELPSHLAIDVNTVGHASFVFTECTVHSAAK